jgi:exportin-1
MACDTFFKIAQKCKRKFMTLQQEEDKPFIYVLINDLQQHVSELQPHQVQAFYEATACMISDHGPAIIIPREEVMTRLMSIPNTSWQMIMSDASKNVQSLYQITTSRDLSKILRTNTRVCSAAGPIYVHQLSNIFLDMLNIYRMYSEQIMQACANQGEIATRLTQYKGMRTVKSDILDLMIAFLEQQQIPDDTDKNPLLVFQTFMPPLMQEVLTDYATAPPSAKDPRVLTLFSTATAALRQYITPEIPRIMDAIFEPTLDLITKNMMDFPEHRIGFFKFLRAANEHSFFGLFSISPPHQKLVIDSIVWAFKHTERNISETGLDILYELLQNVKQSQEFAQAFYKAFLLSLIQDILGILTDRLHKSGFRVQSTILKHIFTLIQNGDVRVPLFDSPSYTSDITNICTLNQDLLKEHVASLVLTAFPNLTKNQVIQFVLGLFDITMDLNAFKQHLRDFLVTVKEFQAEDNSELFSEEVEATRELERMQELQYRSSVPGLLAPVDNHTLDDDDM